MFARQRSLRSANRGRRRLGEPLRLRLESLEDRRLLAQTVGLFVNETESYEGYTLFAPSSGTTTYLIDHDGHQVNSWSSDYPPMSAYLQEDGSLLRTARLPNTAGTINAPGAAGRVELFDWQGELRWHYELNETNRLADGIPDRRLHHDIELLPNGNILMIAWERLTRGQALALGRSASLLTDNNGELWPDMVIEVAPNYPANAAAPATSGGQIVWQWHLRDHVTTSPAAHPERVNINYVSSGVGAGSPGADWTHFNAIDYNPELDQIVVSSREFSEIWIIDHSTTTEEAAGSSGGNAGKGGDLLYRWGNPRTYGRGSRSDQQLFYQHDAQWIEPGLPGEGNILIFNNGWNRADGSNFSSVVEITPTFGNQWYLNNKIDGSLDDVIKLDTQEAPSSWKTITGDWDADGADSVGLFDPATGTFHLFDEDGGEMTPFSISAPATARSPIAGDWDGDAGDEVGLYDQVNHTFHFFDLQGGVLAQPFVTPALPASWLPLAGDWDGDGDDTVGVYDPLGHTFYLNDEIDGSIDRVTRFVTPPLPASWLPLAGDWDGDGDDTVGVYDPPGRTFYLNDEIDGSINRVTKFVAPPAPASLTPVAGNWDGDASDSVGLYDPNYVDGYRLGPSGPYGPASPVWSYTSTPRSVFFATIISGAQRLPNGNTLINEGTEGRFFEVTPAGQIVWQYVNPVIVGNGGAGLPLNQGQRVPAANFGIPGVRQNLAFRAYRYGLDYLDSSLDVTPGAPVELYPNYFETLGFFDPADGNWRLNNHLDGTNTDVLDFIWSETGADLPVTGDWDNDGVDTAGLYDPSSGTFYLANASGDDVQPSIVFQVPGADSSWLPVAGDWDGAAGDDVGLYDPLNHTFYFYDPRRRVESFPAFVTPPSPATWMPLAGDWNADGVDTVGLYDPLFHTFYFNDEIDGSIDTLKTFVTPAIPASWLPLVGDWDGDGDDTPAVYDPVGGVFYLNNKTFGTYDVRYAPRGVSSSGIPLAGDWNGPTSTAIVSAALAEPTAGTASLSSSISTREV